MGFIRFLLSGMQFPVVGLPKVGGIKFFVQPACRLGKMYGTTLLLAVSAIPGAISQKSLWCSAYGVANRK